MKSIHEYSLARLKFEPSRRKWTNRSETSYLCHKRHLFELSIIWSVQLIRAKAVNRIASQYAASTFQCYSNGHYKKEKISPTHEKYETTPNIICAECGGKEHNFIPCSETIPTNWFEGPIEIAYKYQLDLSFCWYNFISNWHFKSKETKHFIECKWMNAAHACRMKMGSLEPE